MQQVPASPRELALPFDEWRAGQPEAITRVTEGTRRITGLVLPTGFGKSLVYMALAKLTGWTTVVLTSTKALMAQLYKDFGDDPDVVFVQGQNMYPCLAVRPGGPLDEFYAGQDASKVTVDHGPCHSGEDCPMKLGGCPYFDAVRAAQTAQVVITNYAWWHVLVDHPFVKLEPDLLVCDEGHAAPDALAAAIGSRINLGETRRFISGHAASLVGEEPEVWVNWAKDCHIELNRRLQAYQGMGPQGDHRELRRVTNLAQQVKKLARMDPDILVVTQEDDIMRFDPIWAAPQGEEYLFRHTPHVVLTSATLTPHTAGLVGVLPKHFDFYEAGDGFDPARRPVYICPALTRVFAEPVRVDHRITEEGRRSWIEHMDQWLDERKDRNGIIHTVSYKRVDEILTRSRHRHRMLTHTRRDTAAQVARFKRATGHEGTIFISPSVTTGYDFPGTECEFQIICKIPFPDGRDPITKARTIVDKNYPSYLAMQELVQSVGRGMRAHDDRCETLIADAHASWFFQKHKVLAPAWFRRALKYVKSLPPAPPRLERSTSTGGTVEETT